LRLVADLEQPTPHGLHRLVAVGEEFQLQVKLSDGWAPIYQLSLEQKAPADWEVANWYTSTSPKSVFTNSLMVARPVGSRRLGLLNTELRIHHRDGRTEKRTLATPEELASVLRDDFDIPLPGGADELWNRLKRKV
jgi:N-hydroxyarylamine O-acetyltransferase